MGIIVKNMDMINNIEIIKELTNKYNTNNENKNIVSRILSICYDFKNKRLTPKRTLEYLKKHDLNLYEIITNDTELEKVGEIIKYYIFNKNIPKCNHCHVKNIILKGKLNDNFDYCSNACTIKSLEVQEKTKNTCIEKYGKRFNYERISNYDIGTHHTQKNITNIDDLNNHVIMLDLQKSGDWRKVAKHFNLSLNSHMSAFNIMRKYGYDIDYKHGVSKPETEIFEYISSLIDSDLIDQNTKQIIKPFELDLYIKSFNLAIEYNGLYWHSSDNKEDDIKNKNRHVNKTKMCEELNINLLHIFENEWLIESKKDIWKSLISSKLNKNKKIFARKCEVREIENSEAKIFCEENHLQGYSVSKRSKGLFYENELVMVATFAKPRYNKKYDNELIRLCSKKYLNIIGGASKILKNEKFISYANRRWSYGNVYEKLNMEKLSITEPNYFYFNNETEIYHRSLFMKHKLKEKLENYNNNLTESENMYLSGYRRIWDSGNILYSNYKNNNGAK